VTDYPPFRDDVDAELRFHIESRTAELMAAGRTIDEARAQAIQEFGGVDETRRYMYRMDDRVDAARRRRNYMSDFCQDVTYAWRRLRAAPGFALTAVLTLALGIGANTAIFSMVNGVLLRPLPFPEPARLYAVYSANKTAGLLEASVSAVDLDDWRAQRQAVEDMGGYFYSEGSSGTDLTGRGAPRRLSGVFITPGFFTTLGVQPARGRLPSENEMVRGGADHVAVLTHGFWVREFGADPAIINSTISLGGQPYTVIGVLAEDMRFPTGSADIYLPFSTIPDTGIPRLRQVRVLQVVARARPGVTEDAVRAELMSITGRLAQQYAEDRAWGAATVRPLTDVVVGPARQGLLVLFGAVGLVLLMACVNVAGLQLARAMGRGHEVAVRLALGARRGRLIRQLLTESLVLSVVGGVLGVVLAKVSLVGLLALSAGQLPRAAEVTLDGPVVAFAIGISILTGLLFGIVPALRTSRGDAQLVVRDGGRSVAGQANQRLRLVLVVTEVAVAMMLVIGAGLMGRSFLALYQVDAGFKADHLLAVQFSIDANRHPTPNRPPGLPPVDGVPFVQYYQDVIEKVRSLPGVVSAAAVKDPPLRGNGERNGFNIPGQPVPAGEDPPSATVIHVSYGYFSTIGARVDGREYTPQDRIGAPFVVMVNEAFARRFFPGERAVGKKLLMGRDSQIDIIGVVNDIRQVAMAEPAQPTIYMHNLQNTRGKMTVVARTKGEPLDMADDIRQAIWSLDSQQAITAVFTFDEAVSRALAAPRLLVVLLASFGLVGLALGAVGVYGILSAVVNERRREIGVRLALGASPGRVQAMIVRRGLTLTAIGVALGLAGAAGLSRFLSTVLYDVKPVDPWTYAGMAGVLIATAMVASWLPARNAARTDPLESLRQE
jgi:predicted permease